MSGQFSSTFENKQSSQWSASQESAGASPCKRSWRRENAGKRQIAVLRHVQVWRFNVETDNDARDAVVADIVDEVEATTETPVQDAEENEVEVNEAAASPPALA